jgi:hypothetical protein
METDIFPVNSYRQGRMTDSSSSRDCYLDPERRATMHNVKKNIILTGLLAMLALMPAGYSDCGSTATSSAPSTEKCDWVCRNLKEDWNYMFHPDRVNQCRPRELEDSKKGAASASTAQ